MVIDSRVCCVGKPQKSSRALCGNLSHSARHLRDRQGALRSLATPGAMAVRRPRKTRTTRKTRGSGVVVVARQGVGLLGIILGLALLRVGLIILLGRLGGPSYPSCLSCPSCPSSPSRQPSSCCPSPPPPPPRGVRRRSHARSTVTSEQLCHIWLLSSQSHRHPSTYSPAGRSAGMRTWSTIAMLV